jgi:peptide/nickel transport system substrate-binding protein
LKSITFYLRKGVKFHDGTDFNAQAAKWCMDKFLEAKSFWTAGWESVEVIDDYTLRLNLSFFTNAILTNLSSGPGTMISPTAVEKNGIEWAKYHPVSTGPFKFKGFERDNYLEMERFDDYWGPRPYLDGIKYIFMADPMTAAMVLQAGEAQVYILENVQVMGPDLEKKGYDLIPAPVGQMLLVPDSNNPDSPFKDKRVREALEYAIDRETIANTLGKGYWEACYQSAPSWTFGYVSEIKGREYNPTKAKQLLTEAGYPNGFKTRIITQDLFDDEPLLAAMANLKDVGIEIDLEKVTEAKYNEYYYKGWNDALFYANHGFPSPNFTWVYDLFLGRNSMRYGQCLWKPEAMLAPIEQAVLAVDFDTQVALSQEAVRVAFDEAVVCPLWSFVHGNAVDKTVHDAQFGEWKSPAYWAFGETWLSQK